MSKVMFSHTCNMFLKKFICLGCSLKGVECVQLKQLKVNQNILASGEPSSYLECAVTDTATMT